MRGEGAQKRISHIKLKDRQREEKYIYFDQCVFSYSMCAFVGANAYMSTFITLSEMGLLLFLRVQTGSLSLLLH